MKMTELNEIVVDENDLIEGLLQGKNAKYIVTKDAEKIDSYNHFCTLFKFDDQIDYETPADTNDKYSYKNADNWWMPDEYRNMNIIDYLLEKTNNEEQYQRVVEELTLFEERNMFPMLKFLVYMVDQLKHNNILWGVGRGSSVASYILYLIGVHRIDSIKYDLDYKEFLR
jgi:DNA polymerase III alpha subunit